MQNITSTSVQDRLRIAREKAKAAEGLAEEEKTNMKEHKLQHAKKRESVEAENAREEQETEVVLETLKQLMK